MPGTNTLAYWALSSVTKEKKFYNIDTRLDYDLVNKKQRANFYPTNVAPLWAECYSYVQLFPAKIARSFKVKKTRLC